MTNHQPFPSTPVTDQAFNRSRRVAGPVRIRTGTTASAARITESRILLHRAMRYASLAGGKRFRPVLVYSTGKALGLSSDELDPIAAAIEIIHAYSLIHDDLPAMDDDDLRRGRPTCHKAFDEATAILAGDALQALAFEVLASELPPASSNSLAVIGSIARACGSIGMAGGQVLDLSAVGRKISEQQLKTMHRLKTGALITAAVTAPGILSQAQLVKPWSAPLVIRGMHRPRFPDSRRHPGRDRQQRTDRQEHAGRRRIEQTHFSIDPRTG